MASCVQVCCVGASSALEVNLAELFAGGEDVRASCSIEHGDAIRSADLEHGVDHLLSCGAHEVLTRPGGEEEQLGAWILLDESPTEDAEPFAEGVDADGVDASLGGIVVAGNDDDDVERVLHVLIASIHARAPALQVEGDAVAVASVVEVFHAVLTCELIVPRVLDGLAVVAHVAVADDSYLEALQRVGGRHVHDDRQQGLAPVLSQSGSPLLVGVQAIGASAAVLFLHDVGLPVLLEPSVGLAVANVYVSGLAVGHDHGEHVEVVGEELQTLLRCHAPTLRHVVGSVPNGLVEHHVGIGPQLQQRVDDGGEVLSIVPGRGMWVSGALHGVVRAEHDAEHEGQRGVCLDELACLRHHTGEVGLVACGHHVVLAGQEVVGGLTAVAAVAEVDGVDVGLLRQPSGTLHGGCRELWLFVSGTESDAVAYEHNVGTTPCEA